MFSKIFINIKKLTEQKFIFLYILEKEPVLCREREGAGILNFRQWSIVPAGDSQSAGAGHAAAVAAPHHSAVAPFQPC